MVYENVHLKYLVYDILLRRTWFIKWFLKMSIGRHGFMKSHRSTGFMTMAHLKYMVYENVI